MAFSDYVETQIVNLTLRNVAWSTPAKPWIALFTTATGDDDSGSEVSGGNYVRIQVTDFTATGAGGTDGISKNATLIRIPASGNAGANWGQVGWWGLFDASTVGNLMYWGQFPVAKQVFTDDHVEIPANALIITLE